LFNFKNANYGAFVALMSTPWLRLARAENEIELS